MGHEEVGHTADIALRVWGDSYSELFREAAAGLLDLTAVTGAPGALRSLSLEAPDAETLLVDWLGELLYLGERWAEAYVPLSVHVEPGWRLAATVRGFAVGEARAKVKAVTYHGLCIRGEAGQYEATIVFDT